MLLESNVQSQPLTGLAMSAMILSSRKTAWKLLAVIAVVMMKVRKPKASISESEGRERRLGPENCPLEAKPLNEGTSLMIVYKPSVICCVKF